MTTTVAALSDGALESLTGATVAGVVFGVPGLIVVRGMGGITTVGDGLDRNSVAATSDGTIVTAVSAGKGCSDASVTGIGVGVGTSPGAAAGDVDCGNSSAGSGNGICLSGFSGVGIGGIAAGAAGVPGVVFGTGDFGSVVGIGIGAVGEGPEVNGAAGSTIGVPAGVGGTAVPVCGRADGTPELVAAPGNAGGVEAAGVPGVVVAGVVMVRLPAGNG